MGENPANGMMAKSQIHKARHCLGGENINLTVVGIHSATER